MHWLSLCALVIGATTTGQARHASDTCASTDLATGGAVLPAPISTPPLPLSLAPPSSATGFEPGLLPAAAALLPGLVLHGAGHWLAGDRATAWRLLAAQGTGLGLLAVGGAPRA